MTERTKEHRLVDTLRELHDRNKWQMLAYIVRDELEEALLHYALRIARKDSYDDLRIIPTEVWEIVAGITFEEQGHLFYGRLTPAELERRRNEEVNGRPVKAGIYKNGAYQGLTTISELRFEE